MRARELRRRRRVTFIEIENGSLAAPKSDDPNVSPVSLTSVDSTDTLEMTIRPATKMPHRSQNDDGMRVYVAYLEDQVRRLGQRNTELDSDLKKAQVMIREDEITIRSLERQLAFFSRASAPPALPAAHPHPRVSTNPAGLLVPRRPPNTVHVGTRPPEWTRGR